MQQSINSRGKNKRGRSEARFKCEDGNERSIPNEKPATKKKTDSDEPPSQEEINKMSKKQQKALMAKYPDHFRTNGAFFGNLNPILIDDRDIKGTHMCFNCLRKNCKRNVCPYPAKFVFCHNCGRRGVSMKTCPRCKDAHAERLKQKQAMESKNSNQLSEILQGSREQSTFLKKNENYNNILYPLIGMQTHTNIQDNFLNSIDYRLLNQNEQDFARFPISYDQRNTNVSDPLRSLMTYDQRNERGRNLAWSSMGTFDQNIERTRNHAWSPAAYDQNMETMGGRVWSPTPYDQNVERMRNRSRSPMRYNQMNEMVRERSRSPISFNNRNERERSRSPISFNNRNERMIGYSGSSVMYNDRDDGRQQISRHLEDQDSTNSYHFNHRSDDESRQLGSLEMNSGEERRSQTSDRLSLLLHLTSSIKGMDSDVRTRVLKEASQSEERLRKLVILVDDVIDLDLEVRTEMLRAAVSP